MYEKRNKRLLIIFALLLCAVAGSIALTSRTSNFDVPADYYRGANLKEVNEVAMTSRRGTVRLKFNGTRWRVNDSFDADRGLVEVLFATLQQAEPKRPVASSMQDSMSNELRENGVKVELYSNGVRVESFFAGGNELKTQAYFVKDEGEKPHLMVIPGYRVYVSGIMELPALKWRERLLFDFNWTNFRQLQALYKNPSGNFTVEMSRNGASISGFAQTDTARLNTFLDRISLLRVDEYVEGNRELDSLANTPPLAEYRISDIGGREYSLKVFHNNDQFVGLANNNQFAILPREDIVAVLRSKDFFVRK